MKKIQPPTKRVEKMKKLSDKKLRQMLSDQCPDVRFIWLTDREYILPQLSQVKQYLEQSKVIKMKFIDDIQDCDDFALQLHAECKRIRGTMVELGQIPREEWKPWSVGECFGIKFKGVKKSHNLNIAACEEGVYLIEPQTKDIWAINPQRDTVLLVRA